MVEMNVGGLVVETLMEKLWDQFTEEKDEAMRDRDSEGDSVDGKSSLDGESGLYPHLASPRHGDGGEFLLPTARVAVTVVGREGRRRRPRPLLTRPHPLPRPLNFPFQIPTLLSGPPPLPRPSPHLEAALAAGMDDHLLHLGGPSLILSCDRGSVRIHVCFDSVHNRISANVSHPGLTR